MSFDAKAFIERWYREVWNGRGADAVDQMMVPDCRARMEGSDTILDRDGVKAYRAAFHSAIPDLHIDLDFVITEGSTTVASWRVSGTHLGPGLGIPPSGRAVDFSGLTLFQIEDGWIVGGFDRWNRGEVIASLMQVRMAEVREHTGLTEREAQVALLMAERFSHQEIASQLGIKANTARRHCERVLQRLGIGRRQDVAEALGMIPVSVLTPHAADLEDAPPGGGGTR